MSFDPKFSFWLGVVVTALIGIGGGAVSFTNAIPAGWIPPVEAWTKILSFFGAGLLTAMHGYSASTPGPLAAPPKLPAIVLLIAGAALLGLLCPGAAYAGWCDNAPPLACENYVRTIGELVFLAICLVGIVVLIVFALRWGYRSILR